MPRRHKDCTKWIFCCRLYAYRPYAQRTVRAERQIYTIETRRDTRKHTCVITSTLNERLFTSLPHTDGAILSATATAKTTTTAATTITAKTTTTKTAAAAAKIVKPKCFGSKDISIYGFSFHSIAQVSENFKIYIYNTTVFVFKMDICIETTMVKYGTIWNTLWTINLPCAFAPSAYDRSDSEKTIKEYGFEAKWDESETKKWTKGWGRGRERERQLVDERCVAKWKSAFCEWIWIYEYVTAVRPVTARWITFVNRLASAAWIPQSTKHRMPAAPDKPILHSFRPCSYSGMNAKYYVIESNSNCIWHLSYCNGVACVALCAILHGLYSLSAGVIAVAASRINIQYHLDHHRHHRGRVSLSTPTTTTLRTYSLALCVVGRMDTCNCFSVASYRFPFSVDQSADIHTQIIQSTLIPYPSSNRINICIGQISSENNHWIEPPPENHYVHILTK